MGGEWHGYRMVKVMSKAPKKLVDASTAARARLQAAWNAADTDPFGWDSTASDAQLEELGAAQRAWEAAHAAVCAAIAPKSGTHAQHRIARHLTGDR